MSPVAVSFTLIVLSLATVQTDDQLIESKPLIEMDPSTAEFENEWNAVIKATCPNIKSQVELADVMTVRYLILTSDFYALSENALFLTDIWDEVLLIETHSESTKLEKAAAKKLREQTLRPILERFQNEINRVLGRMDSVEYEHRVLSEERSGTEVTAEQIQNRCWHELDTSKHDILTAHHFIVSELDAFRQPLIEYYRATQSIRCQLELTERCNALSDQAE